DSGNLTLDYCVVYGNSTPEGGGAFNRGSLAMSYTSVLNNTASLIGGVDNVGSLMAANCLISGNSDRSSVGGLWASQYSSVTLTNTLIGGNSSQTGSRDVRGPVSGTSNLIGDGTGMTGITNGVDGNLVGTSGNPLTAQGHDGALYYLLSGNLYRVGDSNAV